MINKLKIQNLGPLKELSWNPGSNFNLIIGGNDTGKTFVYKMLYTAIRALEDFKRGDSPKGYRQLLDEKMYWTFQVKHLGELVKKGERKLTFDADIDEQPVYFSFSPHARKGVGECPESNIKGRGYYSVFIPPKEVLTLSNVIRKSRNVDQEFGFDDACLDLLNYLDKPTTKGGGKHVSDARNELKAFIGGTIDRDEDNGWQLKKGNAVYDIFATAEGIKKIAIFDRLIGNKVLNSNTVLFIDEPEAHLHPEAILLYMDLLAKFAQQGMQIFLTTHSYFVIKKMYLMALEKDWSTPVVSLENGQVCQFDLREGMPQNRIIQTAVNLFEKEVDLQV